ncbi:MAG: rcc01693 family protein [Roseobacter sp.]
MKGIDWPALMRAGMQGLGLTPNDFWALTPAELQLLMGTPAQSGPMLKSGLETLMASFPDTNRGPQDE